MDTAEVVVEQLRAIGVNAEVVPMDEATWAEQVYKNRQFQATINGLAAKNTTASDHARPLRFHERQELRELQ